MLKLLLLTLLLQANANDELSTLLEQAKPSQPKQVRMEALQKLSRTGKKDPERVLKALEPMVQAKDADIRYGAIIAIGLSGIEKTPCPLCVVKALNDDDERIRYNAGTILSLYQKFPKEAVPLLFAAVDSKDAAVRSAAAESLAAAAGKTPQVKQALLKLEADSHHNVRHSAQQAYYLLTGDLNRYVEYLLHITRDRSEPAESKTEEQRAAEDSLSTLGSMTIFVLAGKKSDGLAKALIHHLDHKDAAIRQCALRQLRAMCVSSKSSFRAVAAQKPNGKLAKVAEKDQNETVRIWAGVVINLLEAGPPKDAPEKLIPLETFTPESYQPDEE